MLEILARLVLSQTFDVLSNIPQAERKRITFLLRNKRISKRVIGKHPNGEKQFSNCCGTTEYVMDNPLMRRRVYEINRRIAIRNGYEGYIPCDNGPAFIEPLIFAEAIEDLFEEVKTPEAGDILTLWRNGLDGLEPIHSGTWLGKDDYFFEQFNSGGSFQFGTNSYLPMKFHRKKN